MIRLDQPDRCAFCGQLIGPDEPKSGRGESAAHVACADAALADDRFWDRIAAGVGDTAPAEGARGGTEAAGSPAAARAGDTNDDVGSVGGEPTVRGSGGRSGAGCALSALLAIVAAFAVLTIPRR